jgi:outer membrane protein
MWTALLLSMLAYAADDGITLQQALDRAATSAASVRGAELGADAAQARTVVARSALLPMVQAQAGLQVWDSKAQFSFAGDGSETPDCTGIPAPFDALCSSLGTPMVVREQVTWSVTARVIQPLTGLVSGVMQARAARAGLDASEAAEKQAVWGATFQAMDAWFSAIEADAQLGVAKAQVEVLEARARVVDASVAAGAAVRNDALQVGLALGRARQGALAVASMGQAARGRLSVAIGGDGSPIAPLGDIPAPALASLPPVEALVTQALAERPDLDGLRAQADAARSSALATSWGRLPQISALGSYTHQEGQALGQPKDSGFFGLNAEWTVWAWDRQGAQTRAAQAQAAQVQVQIEATEAMARMEVATRRDAVETARANWEVAKSAVVQADENVSLFRLRYDSGAATTLELLDAEASAVRARSEEVSARVGVLRAEAALELAVGVRAGR